jgi:hypothetical protein
VLNDYLGRVRQKTAREFVRLSDKVCTRIQTEFTTWTDHEPRQEIIEGIFVDDYVVVWEPVLKWHWPWEAAEAAAKEVRDNAGEIMTRFENSARSLLEEATLKLAEANTRFMDENREVLEGESRLNPTAQYALLHKDLDAFTALVEGYFEGAMTHSGLEQVALMTRFKENTTILERQEIVALVEWLLPFHAMAGIMTEAGGLEEQLRSSTSSCYEPVQQDIENLIQYLQTQGGRLRSVEAAIRGLSNPSLDEARSSGKRRN